MGDQVMEWFVAADAGTTLILGLVAREVDSILAACLLQMAAKRNIRAMARSGLIAESRCILAVSRSFTPVFTLMLCLRRYQHHKPCLSKSLHMHSLCALY